MHCYCMYCTTAKCEFVAESLTAMGFGRAIMPKIVQRKWVKGTAREEVHSYLPGYVFLFSETPLPVHLGPVRPNMTGSSRSSRMSGKTRIPADG